MIGAFICGCTGVELSADEEAFFRDAQPWGLILFARNVDNRQQLSDLTSRFRELVGRADAPVLIDQEGGRVQRMGPPEWRKYPPGRAYAGIYELDALAGLSATRLVYRLLASDLAEVGINVDCLPVLDVPQPGGHKIIGDRAYGASPEQVALLGRAAAQGLMDGGVLPVIKHIPGHGRALSDSHLELPIVDAPLQDLEQTDFAPFAALADAPMAMTAHVVYSAIDEDAPCTLSAKVIGDVVRKQLGFDGLLMSDDLSMKALDASLTQMLGEELSNFRSSMHARGELALKAGCDVLLHCNGDMEEMKQVADVAGILKGRPEKRALRALSFQRAPDDFDVAEAERVLDSMMAMA
ncbi:MAG: beta-N-acetylhexosaminidase [Pseudomonadota bacterium]